MPRWSGCRVVIESPEGGEPFVACDGDVSLEHGRLLVSYFDDDGPVVYASARDAPPRFELICRSRPRVAHLTLSADGAQFSGRWRESDGAEAAWRIELGTPG